MKPEELNEIIRNEAELILSEFLAVESLRLAFGDPMPGGRIWNICIYDTEGNQDENLFQGDLKDAVAVARAGILENGAQSYAQIFDADGQIKVTLTLGGDGKTVTANSYDTQN